MPYLEHATALRQLMKLSPPRSPYLSSIPPLLLPPLSSIPPLLLPPLLTPTPFPHHIPVLPCLASMLAPSLLDPPNSRNILSPAAFPSILVRYISHLYADMMCLRSDCPVQWVLQCAVHLRYSYSHDFESKLPSALMLSNISSSSLASIFSAAAHWIGPAALQAQLIHQQSFIASAVVGSKPTDVCVSHLDYMHFCLLGTVEASACPG